jgi:hypothetical protein
MQGKNGKLAQVNEAIANGVAYLEKQQHSNGQWREYTAENGRMSALCTLALLNSGRTPSDPSVKKALTYLERLPDPERTYSKSLMIMAFAQADPKKYAVKIEGMARTLQAHQMHGDEKNNGGWTYGAEGGGRNGTADNSNSQFAILALHEAERAGVKIITDQTWQRALNYWTQPGMQHPDGSFGYYETVCGGAGAGPGFAGASADAG